MQWTQLTEVCRESQELLPDEHVQRVDGRVTKVFIVVYLDACALFRDAEVLPGLWHVHLVPLHRSMIAVMAMMRDLPAEIWRPEESMCYLQDLR